MWLNEYPHRHRRTEYNADKKFKDFILVYYEPMGKRKKGNECSHVPGVVYVDIAGS